MPLALRRRSARWTSSATSVPPIAETDLDRILKLIPTEVIALYASAIPLLGDIHWPYIWILLFVTGAACVPLVLFLDGRSTGQPAQSSQYVVRTIVFAAWAASLRWPFEPWFDADSIVWMRSLAMIVLPCVAALLISDR